MMRLERRRMASDENDTTKTKRRRLRRSYDDWAQVSAFGNNGRHVMFSSQPMCAAVCRVCHLQKQGRTTKDLGRGSCAGGGEGFLPEDNEDSSFTCCCRMSDTANITLVDVLSMPPLRTSQRERHTSLLRDLTAVSSLVFGIIAL